MGPAVRVLRRSKDSLPLPLYHAGAHLVHWPILKNGHSSLTDTLKGKPFLFERWLREELPEGAVHFAVWRDPFDRYVSALAQVWRMGAVPGPWREFIRDVEVWNQSHPDKPWTCRDDRHFASQTKHLERLRDSDVSSYALRPMFRLDDLPELWQWLESYGLVAPRVMDRQKHTDGEMRRYAENTLDRRPVDRWYCEDLDVWERLENPSWWQAASM